MTRREKPALVLWDIDQTLVSIRGVSREMYAQAFLGVIGQPLRAVAPMAGRTDRAIVTDTLAMHGMPCSDEILADFYAALAVAAEGLRERMRAGGQRLAGAAETLAALDGRGVAQTVATGNIKPIALAKLAALDLAEHLDLAVGGYGSDGFTRAPVIRAAWRRAERRYPPGFAAGQVIVVGDTPLDVGGAREVGAYAVGVATGSSTLEDLKRAGAQVVVSDLFEIEEIVTAVRLR